MKVKTWNNSWFPQTEQVIFELWTHGIVPIIAYLEHPRAIQRNFHQFAILLQQRVLAQLRGERR